MPTITNNQPTLHTNQRKQASPATATWDLVRLQPTCARSVRKTAMCNRPCNAYKHKHSTRSAHDRRPRFYRRRCTFGRLYSKTRQKPTAKIANCLTNHVPNAILVLWLCAPKFRCKFGAIRWRRTPPVGFFARNTARPTVGNKPFLPHGNAVKGLHAGKRSRVFRNTQKAICRLLCCGIRPCSGLFANQLLPSRRIIIYRR